MTLIDHAILAAVPLALAALAFRFPWDRYQVGNRKLQREVDDLRHLLADSKREQQGYNADFELTTKTLMTRFEAIDTRHKGAIEELREEKSRMVIARAGASRQ